MLVHSENSFGGKTANVALLKLNYSLVCSVVQETNSVSLNVMCERKWYLKNALRKGHACISNNVKIKAIVTHPEGQ